MEYQLRDKMKTSLFLVLILMIFRSVTQTHAVHKTVHNLTRLHEEHPTNHDSTVVEFQMLRLLNASQYHANVAPRFGATFRPCAVDQGATQHSIAVVCHLRNICGQEVDY